MSTPVLPVTEALLKGMPLPTPDDDIDKDGRGTVLIAGGSAGSAGAVVLSGLAALRAGAGKVRLAVPRSLSQTIGVGFPEAGVQGFDEGPETHPLPATAAAQIGTGLCRVDAGLIGPGFTDEQTAQELATRLLDCVSGPALVVDALSLTGLWDAASLLGRHRGRLVITPHAGEMARLSGIPKERIAADPASVAREVALRLGCIVVLKGGRTVIAQPEGPSYLYEGGHVGLATSGSGDVLAGVLVALLARGTPAVPAALWSVHLHAQAGRRLARRIGPIGFLARELPDEIPALMQSLAT